MSNPVDIPQSASSKLGHNLELNLSPTRSPQFSPGRQFQIPSPIITRRTRTFSTSEKAASNPVKHGTVKYFCRQRGHGFITPDDGGDDIFFHISDIEGEFAPRHGDEVSYRLCPIPPKNEKMQAIHVIITNLGPGTHERWDCPPSPANDDMPPSPAANH